MATIGRSLSLAVFAMVLAASVLGILRVQSRVTSLLSNKRYEEDVIAEMKGREGSVIEELFSSISEKRLNEIADKYRKEYARALPFPHIAIDGLFPENFIKAVELETREDKFYDISEEVNQKNKCAKGFSLCIAHQFAQSKSSVEKEDNMGPHTRILFSVMKSSNFINFLERLTQIDGILPDPHYRGSGLHFTRPGGFLDIHADFNKYDRFKLDRRVNTFVFLNNDWKEEYGGHLELWNRNMTQCSKRVLPTLGRFFVFSTTDFSYHGHPNALTAPPDRARRSMALYFYSNGRPNHECLGGDCSGTGHSTLYKKPIGCARCEEQTCRAYDERDTVPWIKTPQ